MLSVKAVAVRYKNLWQEIKKQDRILKSGLGEYNSIITFWAPLILGTLFLIFSYFVGLSLKSIMKNIITIMPSLIGFLIASMAIIISIDTPSLNKVPNRAKHSYRQVGGAIFFNATKLSFILLFMAFLAPDKYPQILNSISLYLLPILKFIILWLFSRFIVMVLYGLIYISSSISVDSNS